MCGNRFVPPNATGCAFDEPMWDASIANVGHFGKKFSPSATILGLFCGRFGIVSGSFGRLWGMSGEVFGNDIRPTLLGILALFCSGCYRYLGKLVLQQPRMRRLTQPGRSVVTTSSRTTLIDTWARTHKFPPRMAATGRTAAADECICRKLSQSFQRALKLLAL